MEGKSLVDLHKIQNDLIADRSAEAWYKIPSSGPDFHYRWTYGYGAGGDFSHVIGEHHSHAVCREDASLTMSWGLDMHEDRYAEKLHFDWAEKFVNSTVRAFWVDFFWNNALIDRVELCSIDGAHGLIPFPSYGLEVTDFEESVAFLVYELEGTKEGSPGRYLDEIGAKRVRDSARQGAGSE